jgi:hypothetical protein
LVRLKVLPTLYEVCFLQSKLTVEESAVIVFAIDGGEWRSGHATVRCRDGVTVRQKYGEIVTVSGAIDREATKC